MALIHCPECNREISSKADFCPHCGYKRFSEKINSLNKIKCPKCKRDLDSESKFCPFCGNVINIEKTPEPAQPLKERILPKCPICKRDVAYTSEKCPYCGQKLELQDPPEESIPHLIQCPKCKRDYTRTSEYCPYCGPIRSTYKDYDSDNEEDIGVKLGRWSQNLERASDKLWKFGIRMTIITIVVVLFFLFFARMCA